jgi:hypothetical protein
MSSFVICIMACMNRVDRCASLSCSMSNSAVGTTCHDKPNLSLSQPHSTGDPPPDVSFSQ